MRTAAVSCSKMADAAVYDGEILRETLLDHAADVRLPTIWPAQQADDVCYSADVDLVLTMPRHAPPRIDTSTHRHISIKPQARVVESGWWSGEKKPKPGEKKPEQKPDKKKPRREGGREPREPRQPNTEIKSNNRCYLSRSRAKLASPYLTLRCCKSSSAWRSELADSAMCPAAASAFALCQ